MAELKNMDLTPDHLAIWNEKVKLGAGFLNALAIGLIGFAVLRPMTEKVVLSEMVLNAAMLVWMLFALAIHAMAHYVLHTLRKEAGK